MELTKEQRKKLNFWATVYTLGNTMCPRPKEVQRKCDQICSGCGKHFETKAAYKRHKSGCK